MPLELKRIFRLFFGNFVSQVLFQTAKIGKSVIKMKMTRLFQRKPQITEGVTTYSLYKRPTN